MPLATHAHDAAWFAGEVCRWLPEATLELMADLMGGSTDDVVHTAQFLAAIHDIGKDSPHYVRWFSGQTVGTMEPEQHHDMLGEFVVEQWLAQRGLPTGWSTVVGAHHGWTTNDDMSKDPYCGLEDFLGDDTFHQRRVAMLHELEQQYCPRLDLTPHTNVLMLMAGIVVIADWKASGLPPTVGPHTRDREVPVGLPSFEVAHQSFEDTFQREPRPFQSALADMAVAEPALWLVMAQPGDGKTMAGLYLAQKLCAMMGLGGVVFALPTRLTANMVYHSVLHDWSTQMAALVWLAHASARQNSLYMSTNNAHGTRHQLRMLSPVVLGTVDQTLLSFIRDKHQMVRHLGLAGKVVVIDEVHSYDPYMSRMLDEAIAWLASYRVPVVLMSATLPPSRRSELVRAYTGRAEDVPAATIVRATSTRTVAVDAPSVREPLRIDVSHADNRIGTTIEAARQGDNVLVICHTVKKAIVTARTLRKHLDDVTLIHSRYTNLDRAEREKKLMERFGSEVTQRPRGAVVVSTQLVEQSADLDFDVLVTDLCPTDRIIQRLGRVWRNRSIVRERPPRLVLVKANDLWLYSAWVLEQTRDVWNRTQVVLPTDTEDLLCETYEHDRHPELITEHLNGIGGMHQRASDMLLRRRTNTLRGVSPVTPNRLAVREGDPSRGVVPVIHGRLIDGSKSSNTSRWPDNTVPVPASWHMEGVLHIEPHQYTDDGLTL